MLLIFEKTQKYMVTQYLGKQVKFILHKQEIFTVNMILFTDNLEALTDCGHTFTGFGVTKWKHCRHMSK